MMTIEKLMELDRETLIRWWTEAFGHPPPPRCRAELLRGGLAWKQQLDVLTAVDKRAVNRTLKKLQHFSPTSTRAFLAPGTRLLREWRGQTHHVNVLEDGFEYSGKKYRSLTAITRDITGMSWSGPKFFGLRS